MNDQPKTKNLTIQTKCLVISCPFVESDESSLKFFNFPDDKQLQKLWKEKCGVAANHNCKLAKVCQNHFTNESFTNNTKNPLKPDAVPKQNLDWMFGAPAVESNDYISTYQAKSKTPNLKEVVRTVDDNESLKKQMEYLKKEWSLVEKKLNFFKRKISITQREIAKFDDPTYTTRTGIRRNSRYEINFIGKVFSDAQIDMLMGKKKVVWSHNDMAMAFTLRHIGNRELYLYLKDTLNLPLPSLSSVQRWAAARKSTQ